MSITPLTHDITLSKLNFFFSSSCFFSFSCFAISCSKVVSASVVGLFVSGVLVSVVFFVVLAGSQVSGSGSQAIFAIPFINFFTKTQDSFCEFLSFFSWLFLSTKS
ncbi:hypothetical protein II582_04210 [bacterium]|nr:hypothetical protein [bacterium]